ncbi:MAG: hypothetical protein HOL02_15570 [Rhodospirillaceae bacterium]|jgi:hypothetical protein|nr:hypothetical protein [Rhodospirillaceae bacterium]MBT6511852.1 hypothetical protein [Rhodospirillaceae bacterium]MBT7613009.1 hypothetical protein [Rhodospirillaceae bacterium]MBT7648536.1 hypothetical protein [Rhodospirillaceae bacterium]
MNIDPENPTIHSDAQRKRIFYKSKDTGIPSKVASAILAQMTQHGYHQEALEIYGKYYSDSLNHHIKKLYDRLKLANIEISEIHELDIIMNNRKIVESFLSDKNFFWEGETDPEKLIIVFSTAYNNFDISFPDLHAVLMQYGFSILYLKNPDRGMFAGGCPGLGTSIDTMKKGLLRFLDRHGIVETFVTGYSSSGYASLYLAGELGASSYLGFGIKTDWSRTTTKKTVQGRVSPSQ